MSKVQTMPLEIWTDINGNATRTQFTGGVKYIRADERDRLRKALEDIRDSIGNGALNVNWIKQYAEAALTPAGGQG